MKKQSTNLLTQIGIIEMTNLTTIVKETLATGFNPAKEKTFTTADLWMIQRPVRRRSRRKF